MIAAILNAIGEGRAAASLAADAGSAKRLRVDFILSRLLKFCKLPGYNTMRQARMRNGLVVNYRLNRGDIQSLREVLVDEVYRCEMPMAAETILDLGANIGLASLWLAGAIRPNPAQSNQIKPIKVIAVEPVPENAEVARLNFADNSIPGEVIQAAVGLVDGEGSFEARRESNLGRLAANETGGGLKVSVVGIRSLLDRFPSGEVDLVKMDIEGGEGGLLGADTGWLRRVKMLMIEWHDEQVESAPLIRNAEAAGFRHQRINAARQDNLSLLVRC